MAIIKSENWDGVVAPAIPAGWTVDTGLLTSVTGAVSAPNALVAPTTIAPTSYACATWATLDTNGGDVQVSTTVSFAAPGTVEQDLNLLARCSQVLSDANFQTGSYYQFHIRRGSATTFWLQKMVAGTGTVVAGPASIVLADATNYRIFLRCAGTTIACKVQRVSDSFWLTAGGSFVSDPTNATSVFSVTDASVAGAGYASLAFYTAAGGGAIYTDDFLLETALPPPTVALTAPVAFQTSQRNVPSNSGAIAVAGTVSNGPADVEASFNGGAYQTIASAANGAFTGTLLGQSAGQGTLVARPVGNPAGAQSVASVGIGDVFVLSGQSNASGRATNNQPYTPSPSGVKAALFGNDGAWRELADPTDSASGQLDAVSNDGSSAGGSYWPRLATQLLAARPTIPVAFVPCAMGGTAIASWQPGSNHQDRATLYGSQLHRALAVGGVRAVLWHQGETDAQDNVSTATYLAALQALGAALWADLGAPLLVAKLQQQAEYPQAQQDAINAAITQAWTAGGAVRRGADLSALVADDPTLHIHLIADADMQAAGAAWASALESSVYAAVAGGVRRVGLSGGLSG